MSDQVEGVVELCSVQGVVGGGGRVGGHASKRYLSQTHTHTRAHTLNRALAR